MCSSAKRSDGEKPKRAGLPKGTVPDEVDLDRALALLSLPREDRPASRGRRADHRRHRPLRTLCAARQDLRQSRSRRRHLPYRAQSGGDADRREDAPRARASAASAPIRAARSASIRPGAGRSWRRTAATVLMSATTASTPRCRRQDAGDHHARRGGRVDRCPRRARSRPACAAAQGQAAVAGHRAPQSRLRPNGPAPGAAETPGRQQAATQDDQAAE